MGGASSENTTLDPGAWTFSVGAGAAYSHAEHDVEPSQFEPHVEHDEDQARRHVLDFGMFQTTLIGSYGLRSWLTLKGMIPLRFTVSRARFLDAENNDLPDFSSIHHRDEWVVGFGDPLVAGRFRLPLDGLASSLAGGLTMGVSMPVGNVEADPFVRGSKGLAHQHVFFGTGTWNPHLALDLSIAFDRWSLVAWTSVDAALYAGRRGYKGPTIVTAGVAARSSLGMDNWSFMLHPEVFHEEPATWGDNIAKNSGKTEVLLGAGVNYTMECGTVLGMVAKGPVYTQVLGGQLDIPLFVNFSSSWSGGP